MSPRPETLVIGLGNRLRGDDAIGPQVARELRQARCPGLRAIEWEREPLDLLDLWAGAGDVVVVDALAGSEPGRIHRLEASDGRLGALLASPTSTHALDVGAVIELAGTLRRLPSRLRVIAIEGRRFQPGRPPVEPVREAGRRVVAELLRSPTVLSVG